MKKTTSEDKKGTTEDKSKDKSSSKLEGKATAVPTAHKYVPPTVFQIEKAKVKDIEVGSEIAVTVRGEVTSIRKAIGETEGLVEIELANPKVAEVESNEADVEYRRMIEQK